MNNNIILLYGSTGDLTFRKILPALIYLQKNTQTLNNTKIVAIGRRDFTNDDYYNFIVERNKEIKVADLKELVTYLKMEITKDEEYPLLKEFIDNNSDQNTKVYHYLAIASDLMGKTLTSLRNNNIVEKTNKQQFLIFEKPYGNDYLEALKLNETLDETIMLSQVFHVDHYLGKPFVDYLLKLKYEQQFLKAAFHYKNINKIEIVLKEEDGVLDRGPFYDETGAVSDMFQSHILQMVSLLLMEPKIKNNNYNIVNAKTKALKQVVVNTNSLVFGQYLNYLEEDRIKNDSLTETLFACQLFVTNKHKKIPVNIITGKALDKKESYIKLYLKDNVKLRINIFPNNNIEFKYYDFYGTIALTETVMPDYSNLFKAILDNQKQYFVSTEEILIMHKITDEIKSFKNELIIYKKDLNINDIIENF